MSGSYSGIASSSGVNQNPRIHSDMVSHDDLHNFGTSPDQIYDLTANMEMNMVYNSNHPSSSRNLQQWRGFLNKLQQPDGGHGHGPGPGPGPGPSTSKELNAPTSTSDQFYHHDLTGGIPTTNEAALAWINMNHHLHNRSLVVMDNGDDNDDDPSLRSCVFPCEGSERPSQGLSLSLNPSNPSIVTVQSFEHRQPVGSSHFVNQHSFVRNSKYLGPAQDLLSEFCNLGANQQKFKLQKKISNDNQDEEANRQSLHSLDLLQLQIRKTKLCQMLQEVDRRYNHYCDQMKDVVSSFEEVAGNGAAAVYSAMASRAMSRHFRCLRDAIINQMKATKKAIEDKNGTSAAAPGGAMVGETPRLKLLDQRLRQQKALQQMSLMETHPWRPQRGLPERSVSVLRAWLFEHFLHPYPSDVDKHILSRQTGLSRSQVSNWFINARVRLWKPMVEEMYTAELQDDPDETKAISRDQDRPNNDDRKPTLDQTVRKDSGSLSSIINNNTEVTKALEIGRVGEDSYGGGGAMELDFSSYSGGVSLTLGLHHHTGGGGMRLAFPQASQSSGLFYPRDQMETVQHQYTLLENDQSHNLPYRNLMGAQLLHDLAG